MQLTPKMLKGIIAEEVKKLNEDKRKPAAKPPTTDELVEHLKQLKITESKLLGIKKAADRKLAKLQEAKQTTTKRLLKRI